MLEALLGQTSSVIGTVLDRIEPQIVTKETGTVTYVGRGVAEVSGLPGVKAQELVEFVGGVFGLAFNLDADSLGVVLLGPSESLGAGTEVRRTGRVVDVPVGRTLLGRVVNALGQAMDELPAPHAAERRPIEKEAPAILDRAPVNAPLQTGIKVIDTLIPIGKGQRQLILGDRQIGKTSIALDTIANQRNRDVVCVYCAIGQRGVAVVRAVEILAAQRALAHTIVVVAAAHDPPGLQFITPYAATTMAEYFSEQGQDVLIVYDDLTRHARAYRELSLLLRRPPGREAYPGDIFYVHSRLLERATRLSRHRGGGSLTALAIVETEAENISAYIPTNIISITDGQTYLSPVLFRKGHLPAIDVGKSVSRVGGRAQLPAYRTVAGPLKLSYSQFEELEIFARFGTRLDEDTRQTLERGRRVREILKQAERSPLGPCEQIAVLLAVTEGLFDAVPLSKVPDVERAIQLAVADELGEVCRRIHQGEVLDADDREAILSLVRQTLRTHGLHDGHP